MLSPGRTNHRLCYNCCSCRINYRLIWTGDAIDNLRAHPVEFIVGEVRNRFCIFINRAGAFSAEQLSSACSRRTFSNFKERDDEGEGSLDTPVNY